MKLRKFEAVDIEELLTKIGEKIIRTNQDYLQMDIETFKKAATTDKSTNFLWLAHPNGTWCFNESEVYIKGSSSNYIWLSFMGRENAIEAVAVTVHTLENNRIIGDIYSLNHYEHCKEIQIKSHQALSAEIHFEENNEKKKICIPMKEYKIEDYWKPSVTKINFTIKNEHDLAQTITSIRKKRNQSTVKGSKNDYLKDIEQKIFLEYLWIYDKKKTVKENIKLEKYKALKQEGYVFIRPEEAIIARKLSIPFKGIDRYGDIQSIYRTELENYWKSGGYLCMEKEWRQFLIFLQTKPELPYSKMQLQLVKKLAQDSYNTVSKTKKQILGFIIAKITVILNIYDKIKDQISLKPNQTIPITSMQEVEFQQLTTNVISLYFELNDTKRTLSAEESAFSEEERKTVRLLLENYKGMDKQCINRVAEKSQESR